MASQEVSAVPPSWEGLSQEGNNPQAVNNIALSQADRQAVNSTPSPEGLSQEGSNSQAGNNLASQAGSQAINSTPSGETTSQEGSNSDPLPGDSTTFQEASASSKNIPSREGPSWAGNNPPQIQCLLKKAGR